MKKNILLLLLSVSTMVSAQQITGRLVDKSHTAIDYATVILQTPDSINIAMTQSDSLGEFTFSNRPLPFRMIVQHISYNTKILDCHSYKLGDIVMDEKSSALGGVVVTGHKAYVKVENGALKYDLSTIAQKKVVNSLYDLLIQLPGVDFKNGNITLAGASKVNILINGRPSSMSEEQLLEVLRDTPARDAAGAEIFYNTPPSYHVRGASINITLNRYHQYIVQGEVNSGYTNSYYGNYSFGSNISISTPKLLFETIYSTAFDKNMDRMTLDSEHEYHDKLYLINQGQKISNKGCEHMLHSSVVYNYSDKTHLDLSFNSSWEPDNKMVSKSDGTYQSSIINQNEKNHLYNLALSFRSSFGLSLNIDYTNYYTSNNQNYTGKIESSPQSFSLVGSQRVDKIQLSADQEHHIGKKMTFGYGMSYENATDKDYQFYSTESSLIETQNTDAKVKEQMTDFYCSLGKNSDSGVSFSLSASGEYYSLGNYHRWAFYPQASLTYKLKPGNVFILSMSSDKKYPSYWQMQSSVTYLDGYTEIRGTTGLRPCKTLNLSTTYILNNSHTFTFFYEDNSDYFTQMAYQASDRLALVYQTRNWNYSRQLGIVANTTFTLGKWLDTDLSAVCLRMSQKCDNPDGISFDRNKNVLQLSLSNTAHISKYLTCRMSNVYTTPLIQGQYDLSHIYETNLSLMYRFKEKMRISIGVNDLFNSGTPKVNVRYNEQHFNMKTSYYSRSLFVKFVYTFGGYKSNKHKEIDKSRFGH
jgi:hypothetical protein